MQTQVTTVDGTVTDVDQGATTVRVPAELMRALEEFVKPIGCEDNSTACRNAMRVGLKIAQTHTREQFLVLLNGNG